MPVAALGGSATVDAGAGAGATAIGEATAVVAMPRPAPRAAEESAAERLSLDMRVSLEQLVRGPVDEQGALHGDALAVVETRGDLDATLEAVPDVDLARLEHPRLALDVDDGL